MARIITITSGKGGVGKTSISLNLSLSLASRGHRVCLFDADLGLANVNILTGIYPEKDLVDVINGRAGLSDILIRDYQGVDILPGSSGVAALADLSREQAQALIRSFLDLSEYDYVLFDTSAGISAQVLSFCMASHEIVLVATCEPTAMTDAYAMLKTLSKNGYENPVRILINQARTGKAAKQVYAQLKETVNRFLDIRITPLGIVGWDKGVRMAVVSQTPFIKLFPDGQAARCISAVTDRILAAKQGAASLPLEIFWDRCLSFFEGLNPSRPEEKKAGNPPETAEDRPEKPLADPEFSRALARLETRMEKRMDSLAKKIAGLEKLILAMSVPSQTPAETQTVPEKPPLPEPKKITLDFESWLAGHRKRQSQ